MHANVGKETRRQMAVITASLSRQSNHTWGRNITEVHKLAMMAGALNAR